MVPGPTGNWRATPISSSTCGGRLGIEPGDVVAALVDNGNTLIECALATHEAGLQFTPLNTHLTAHELTTIMDHSGCKVLVAGARFAPLLAGLDAPGRGCAC